MPTHEHHIHRRTNKPAPIREVEAVPPFRDLRRLNTGRDSLPTLDRSTRSLSVVQGVGAELQPGQERPLPHDRRKVRCAPDEAEETVQLGPGRFAYYRIRETRDHTTGIVPRSVHTWWYRCLKTAGVVEDDLRGFNMHRGRHTVASDILRRSGNIVAAQQMLGHTDVKTTVESYAAFDDSDLEAVLRSIAEGREV